MSRHNSHKHNFSRDTDGRTALLNSLVKSLVLHGRIKTTVPRAKELRRHVERAVTIGKRGDLHGRRLLLARYPNQDVVNVLVGDLSTRFKAQNGGYTRIIKLGARPGDKADMAYIEFTDYKLPEAKDDTKVEGDTTKVKKLGRDRNKAKRAKRKHLRKIQAASRRRNRE